MKIFYICPHLSTGGQPQYALKMAQSVENEHDVTVFEVENQSPHFTVQKKQFKNLIELNKNQELLLDYIAKEKPDVLHFQEIPETFMKRDVLSKIYDKKREYFIIFSAHGVNRGRHEVQFLPDKIVAVSNWQKAKFKKEFPEVEIDLWEYPIEDLKPTKEEKHEAREKLYEMMNSWQMTDRSAQQYGTSGYWETKHVLNVGLFTPYKNQGELFDIARKNPNICYHFVGNQAGNFRHYWEPLMKHKPSNCFIWGERDDVDLFYKACDEMYFASTWELFPITIREALSYGLPIKMHKLDTYGTDYDNNRLIEFI